MRGRVEAPSARLRVARRRASRSLGKQKKKKTVRTRRRERKNVVVGEAHIQSTFNNTIVSITDPQGNVVAWWSAGPQRLKGTRKSASFAPQRTAHATPHRD